MIKFENQAITGHLVKRYKRFFMDVLLENGEIITAHTANTGSMKGLLNEGNEVLLTINSDEKRKTRFDVQAIKIEKNWVGVNTQQPNRIVKEALLAKNPLLKDFHEYQELKSEVKFGVLKNSRVDFVLSNSINNKKDLYLEVKNVTLKENNVAMFPDSVSVRGQKHIEDLENEISKGHQAALFFLVQREDVEYFSPAAHIDKKYAELLTKAQEKGLIIVAVCSRIDSNGIYLTKQLRVIL